MLSRAIFAIIATVLLLALPLGVQADTVGIRMGQHEGYGRLMFDWPKPVGFTLSGRARNPVLTFDRPISADLRGVPDQLASYVLGAALQPDGQSIHFTLADNFQVRTVQKGSSVGLDFITQRAERSASAADLPKAANLKVPTQSTPAGDDRRSPGRSPGNSPLIVKGKSAPSNTEAAADAPISVAEKDDFTRVVLPWGNTKHSLEKRGSEFVLIVERPLDPDLSVLRVEKPKGVQSASGKKGLTRFGLHLRPSPGYSVRSFTEDGKIVLDLIAPSKRRAPHAPELPSKAAAPAQEASGTPPGTALVTQQTGGTVPVAARITPTQSAAKNALPAEPAAQSATPEAPVTPRSPILRADDTALGTRLTLAFAQPVAAAVFIRAGHLWAVFDSPSKVNFSQLPLRGFKGIGTPGQIADEKLTVLRVPLVPGFSGRAIATGPGASGTEWTIEVAPEAQPLALLPIAAEPQADGGGQLRIAAPNPVGPFSIADPELGDTLIVVPMGSGWGLAAPRRYVDANLLPSPQGLAIEPQTDRLDVRVSDNTVLISRPGGLALSPEFTEAARPGRPTPIQQRMSAIGAPGTPSSEPPWHAEPAGRLRAKREALELAVARSEPTDRARRRLELASFYLHNDLAAEALGILTLAAREDADVGRSLDYRRTRGQAEYLMGRNQDAATTLAGPDLASDPDALIWRGRALAESGRAVEAWSAFQSSNMATLGSYPASLQASFRIAAAQSALATGDTDAARRQLAAMPTDLPPTITARTALVKAQLTEHTKDPDHALALYDEAIQHGGEAVAIEGRLRKVVLARRLGRIGTAAAVEDLERLRFAWRGDRIELESTAALGDIYLADGRYREALAAFDDVGRLFPSSSEAAALNARVRGVFADLFLNGKADQMEPIKALGLFLDHRDLTPVGREGDEMIRKLADRLASVDLLDQAEALLDYQIKNRLDGVAKAQIAAKLAALALLNHDPNRALAAIRETRQTALPDVVNEKRRMIEAQALMELGQTDDAMELIARYTSRESELLRAEIHWHAREWQQAANSLVSLLGDKPRSELSDTDRQMVMKAAISFALAGDQNGLASLRACYEVAMVKSADAASFEVLTGPIDVQGLKFRELASKIAGLDSLQSFLKSYKESL